MTDDTQPSEAPYTETNDDGERTVERVELGAATIDADEFATQLHAISGAAEQLGDLQATIERIETGLTEEDAVRLIYGRSGWSLSDIRKMFGTLDQIEGASDRKLVVRLLADLGNVTLDDAEEFYEEVERLRKRYGDLAEDDDG